MSLKRIESWSSVESELWGKVRRSAERNMLQLEESSSESVPAWLSEVAINVSPTNVKLRYVRGLRMIHIVREGALHCSLEPSTEPLSKSGRDGKICDFCSTDAANHKGVPGYHPSFQEKSTVYLSDTITRIENDFPTYNMCGAQYHGCADCSVPIWSRSTAVIHWQRREAAISQTLSHSTCLQSQFVCPSHRSDLSLSTTPNGYSPHILALQCMIR